MPKQTMTVICRDNTNTRNNYEGVLIYTVEADPADELAVFAAVIEAREADMGKLDEDEREAIQVLFAFEGNLAPIADWRD
jgi:hypothetical protein